ncbi:unnamed protein product [Cylicocyclus nassatus]|uniref:Uncharacterized protein n=1 Tax=Cylicocyclus nassatus TaxID=53992 RepID=A0AA36GLD6_CYLNA|nr:unnamed protein product [Cylicocyclus nassatus]
MDLHPTETWLLAALTVEAFRYIYESQLLLKSFKICDLPVRAAKFISRRNWLDWLPAQMTCMSEFSTTARRT